MATEFCQKCKQAHPGRVCDYDEKGECARCCKTVLEGPHQQPAIEAAKALELAVERKVHTPHQVVFGDQHEYRDARRGDQDPETG